MSVEIGLTSVDELVRGGEPRERGARLAAAGELVRVRRGVYANGADWSDASAAARHLAAMRAAVHKLGPETLFSHESAALALGIPLLGPVPQRPHVIVRVGGAKTSSAVIRTQRPVPRVERSIAGPFHVTSPAVTVVDLAATRGPLSGVIAASHARSTGMVSLEGLVARASAGRPFRGARRVDAAIAASTSGSESPLETLVLMRIRDLGFAEPEQQREVLVEGHRYRVDFAWEQGAIILEADGRVKYGADATDVVLREKAREDAIRSVTARFVRTTWQDAWDGIPLERTLLRAAVPRPRRPRPFTR